MVEVRVQTMYREMETQTFPWSPPYVKISQDEPEILLLNNLKWGDGLPAGKHEVEEISRSRKKRAWEIYLASIQKTADASFRKRIISQIEKDDWEFIAQDLEKISEQRMELAKKVLDEQRADFSSKLALKLDRLNKNIIIRYEEKVKQIEHEKNKELRRIRAMMKKTFVERHEKKTILDKYNDRISDLYAFRVRLGFQRKNTSVVLCEDAYNMVKEDKLKPRKFTPPNRAGKTKKHNCLKEQFINATESELDDYFDKFERRFVDDNITKLKEFKDTEMKQSDATLHFNLSEEGSKSEGPDKEITKLSEGSEDSGDMERKRQRVLDSFKRSCLEKYKRESVQMHTGGMESGLLAKLLDLTSKERDRLEEEKKILAMALRAQAERWRREAREAGIRQKQHMRETIKKRILDQAFEMIGEDVQDEFESILRDSLLGTAVAEAEEDMRVKLYDIDRDLIPKADEGKAFEELIAQLTDHVQEQYDDEYKQILIHHKDGSMSDLGEIASAVNDLYDDIISTALELDGLMVSLNDSNVKESKFLQVEERLEHILSKKEVLPGLEGLKKDMLDIYSDYVFKQDLSCDIKRMDKLCDTIIELADELYEIIIGDADIKSILENIDRYNDAIVNDELLKHLDKKSTTNLFKIMKISHILGKNNQDKLYTDFNNRIRSSAKKVCSTVSKIAVKIDDLLFKEKMGPEKMDEMQQEMENYEEDSFIKNIKQTRMERLCDKLLDKKSDTKKVKKTQTEVKLEDISVQSSSKIDVCQIKMEAAEIIESIVEVWLGINSMFEQITTTKDIDELHESIINKLKCAIEKLEEQFGDTEDFPGFHLLLSSVEPSKCKDKKIIKRFLKHPPPIILHRATEAVDTVIKAAAKVTKLKSFAPLDLTLDKLVFINDPLRSDVYEMAQKPKRYPGVQQITQKEISSSGSTGS